VIVLLLIATLVLAVMLTRTKKSLADEQQRSLGLTQQLTTTAQSHSAEMEQRAQRAVAASRGSYNGHVAQQAFPYAPDNIYNPKDIFHLGGVMDYIVFDGLDEIRNNSRDPRTLSVVFVDVKWGSSRASTVQMAVIEAMNVGRTRGEIWHSQQSAAGGLTYTRREAA
jgi:predicted Holliday junction resolvase-like endonuclease